MKLKLHFQLQLQLHFQLQHENEVENEVEVKLNQTKLNWALTQLKSNLVYTKLLYPTYPSFSYPTYQVRTNLGPN